MTARYEKLFPLQEEPEKAFSLYFARHYAGIRKYLLRMGKDLTLAEDLAQEAFIILFENKAKIANEQHLLGFLHRTARNAFIRHLRRAKACRKVGGPPYSGDFLDVSNPGTDEIPDALLAALECLSPRRKLIVEMRFFKECDVKTIASRLRISEQTVRNTLTQSLAFLHDEINCPCAKKKFRVK